MTRKSRNRGFWRFLNGTSDKPRRQQIDRRRLRVESFERRMLLAGDITQPPINPEDVASVAPAVIELTPHLCADPSSLALLQNLARDPGDASGGPTYGEVNPEQIQRMLEAPTEGPFYMVNLIRFRDEAEYLDGRETDPTGREAAALYDPEPFITAIGGQLVFIGDVDGTTLGDDKWDQVAIVEYPCPIALFAMNAHPDFQATSVHKDAGVEESIVMVSHLESLEDAEVTEPPFPSTEEDPSFETMRVLHYNDEAQYPECSDELVRTGEEAMDLYASSVQEAGQAVGIHPTARLVVEGVFIGDGSEWDEVWIDYVPSNAAFEAFSEDSTVVEAQQHFDAAVEDVYGLVFTDPELSSIPDETENDNGTAGETDSGNAADTSLSRHDGYWIGEVDVPGVPISASVINDTYYDPDTDRMTVYAQSRVGTRVLAPVQVGPGECTQLPNGSTGCFHPNAVYLNGSGEELMAADGTGEWWVKHSWIVDGEGYMNYELGVAEEYHGIYVEGHLLEDGSIKVGGLDSTEEGHFFNIRDLDLEQNSPTLSVTRFMPANTDPNAGEIDLTPVAQPNVVTMQCSAGVSALDGSARGCPMVTDEGSDGGDNDLDDNPVIMTTSDGTEFVRTPDSRFENLPDWPYEPHYVEIDGLRQAYVDEGPEDGPVVLLLHGQPSWSYLYRDMIPVLADAGYRVIAMDHLGMGRSDKPIDIERYSYLDHNHRLEEFISELGLTDINLFVQDWGSLIGLRTAGLNTDLFASISIGNGALPVFPEGENVFPPVENPDEVVALPSLYAQIPEQQVSFYDGCERLPFPGGPGQGGDSGQALSGEEDQNFGYWMRYAMTGASFQPSETLEALTWFDLTPEEEAAYDAPFPSRTYMAGPRVFPSLINDVPGTTQEAWEGLNSFDKPFLTIWGANDPGNLGSCEAQQQLIDNIPGAEGQPHTRLPEASHFLQDDQGEEIATRLIEFYELNDLAPGDESPDVNGSKDINADGTVSRSDALIVINFLNEYGSRQIEDAPLADPLDVNRDGFVSALDALIVINQFNRDSGSNHASVRGFRYCELIVIHNDGGTLHGEVWGTQGLNDCPAEAWDNIDLDQVAQQLGAATVRPNGPRYWMSDTLDSIEAPDGPVRNLGGIEMQQLATLAVTPELLQQGKPYTPKTVDRSTVSSYYAGSEVYELTSPTGEVFVMQSYSHAIDTTLTEADLSSLGARLELPEGWSYSSRILEQPIEIRVENTIQVLQDELGNSYSQQI